MKKKILSKKLKNGKAPGYEFVINEHIVSILSIFLPLYQKLVASFQMNSYSVLLNLHTKQADPSSLENIVKLSTEDLYLYFEWPFENVCQ